MLNPIQEYVKKMLNEKLIDLEKHLNADIISITGPMANGLDTFMLHVVEQLKKDENTSDKLYIILTTNGGDAIIVERLVNILRHNYKEIDFIIPDHAYSAGTIFCMSGDNIYMDYYSVLGPIDPQVQNRDGRWVPALGYLDKINELLDLARRGTISQAEFLILKDFDLAELRAYEQAKELTVDLLKKWLVQYKFKNWDKHSTSNLEVTIDEKKEKAREIAIELGNHARWKSHGRPLNINILRDLGLKIEDYSLDSELRELIRDYYVLLTDNMRSANIEAFIHSRRFI